MGIFISWLELIDIEIPWWVEIEVEEETAEIFYPTTARAVLKNAAFFLQLANFQIQIHF